MTDVKAISYRREDYLVDQDGGADFQGGWVSARDMKVLIMHVTWTAIVSTAGTLSIQASENQGNGTTPAGIVTLTPTVVHGAQPTGGTAGALIIIVENIPSLFRLAYTRSAGGGAAQFDASYNLRGI